MALVEPTDLVARFDVRTLGDLVNDEGQRISEGELLSHPRVVEALSASYGKLKTYVLRGNRYSEADLAGLTGDDLAALKDLVCMLAFMWLHRRRHWVKISDAMKHEMEMVKSALEALGSGEQIFNVEGVRAAGVAKVVAVSRVEARRWNLVVDRVRGKQYPVRRVEGY